MALEGHELADELRSRQAEVTLRLCREFVQGYPEIVRLGVEQVGDESFYLRRRSEDSRLDPHKSIAEQFNLLRVVDNERYPAYFDLKGHRYILKIERECKVGE